MWSSYFSYSIAMAQDFPINNNNTTRLNSSINSHKFNYKSEPLDDSFSEDEQTLISSTVNEETDEFDENLDLPGNHFLPHAVVLFL